MSLEPLLEASLPIRIHAFSAMAAILIGALQLARKKGTASHRLTGYIWGLLMLTVAASSFWIHELRLFGEWSPIHLLSVLVLVAVPIGVWSAHQHRVREHRTGMIRLYGLALILTGLFTLLPGRIMHEVVFGS
ncbi:DUF2306 domain-containing protein [Chelativorans sp. J32]|uniref:DUF2306 domain-containing protein n=1 Tax=Chelativorans sp. J32 TaxID=935840 RepID=UPI000489DE64|nr:DUF2306 domain-containing protein [Chelativorans sp. J32]